MPSICHGEIISGIPDFVIGEIIFMIIRMLHLPNNFSIFIDQYVEMQETMMVGLRLVELGVSNLAFQSRFNKNICDVFNNEILEVAALGLVEWVSEDNDQRLRLTKKGRLLGNRVFMQFVGN